MIDNLANRARGVGAMALIVLFASLAAGEPADPVLFRVFLTDGTSVASYGEFARVDDRLVFSMPIGHAGAQGLHLVNLPASTVDWDRTLSYAESARTTHYFATRAEEDFTALTADTARLLNQIVLTPDPARRIAMAEDARRRLAGWPAAHFGYRQVEVRQIVSLLDEAIADMRATQGADGFSLSLVAAVEIPPLRPLLPPPTLQESIEQVLRVASLTDVPAERLSLLRSAKAAVDRQAARLPSDWLRSVRGRLRNRIEAEVRVDRAYANLTRSALKDAGARAARADVPGVQRVLDRVASKDGALGRRRPGDIHALMAAVQSHLDAARRLKLAHDRWALRLGVLDAYRRAVSGALETMTRARGQLEDIKSLAGLGAGALDELVGGIEQASRIVAGVVPPEEMQQAHGLLKSATQLAGRAAQTRREAVLSGNMARAWDASAAAAGSMMLLSRARSEMEQVFRPPQLR